MVCLSAQWLPLGCWLVERQWLGTFCLHNARSIFWEEVVDSGGMSQHSLDVPLLGKHCGFLQVELGERAHVP